MSQSSSSSSGGVGFFGLLTILFIGLKLGGVIAWSWVWVLSPLWIPLAILLAGLMVFAAGLGVAGLFMAFTGNAKRSRR